MSKPRMAIGLVVLLTGFHASGATTPKSDSRQAVLDSAVELSEQNALNALKVDWPSAKRTATDILLNDNTDAGLAASIRYVLGKLQDRHSFYRPLSSDPAQSAASEPHIPKPIAAASASPAGTPLLVMNSWAGRDVSTAATKVRQELTTALNQQPCGIIVDLSPNGGGNMWPMVIGLLPLLTDGTLGAFEDREKKRTSIVSTGNGLLVAGSPHSLNTLNLIRPNASPGHVAVIVGPRTASSGEITAILFKGQDNVRFFGRRTAGVPTANRTFTLSNGALLALTTAVALDRDGNGYTTSVTPDVETDDPIGAADNWINSKCSSPRPRRAK